MLKSETKTKLKALGFDVDKLVAAATHAEEQDFEVPAINNLTEEQLTERDKNTVAAARDGVFKEGKKAGIEIANKVITKKYGLTDVDVSDPDKVVIALDAKVAKGDTGLQEQINLLQKDKTTLEAAIEAEKGNSKALLRDTELLGILPAKRSALLTDKEYLLAIKANLQIEEVDGVEVVKKDGVILRDPKTQAAIAKKDAINTFFNDRKWLGEADGNGGGRGGGDNAGGGGAGLKTFSKYSDQWLKDNPGKNLVSPDFHQAVDKYAKDNTGFDFEN